MLLAFFSNPRESALSLPLPTFMIMAFYLWEGKKKEKKKRTRELNKWIEARYGYVRRERDWSAWRDGCEADDKGGF